jgi:hypothetical protein
MSKTVFVNRSKIIHTFMNTIFGNGAGTGHIHDDADADGHAGKINLGSHITGTLPLASLAALSSGDLSGSTVPDAINSLAGTSSYFDAVFPTAKILRIYYKKNSNGTVKMWWGALSGLDSSHDLLASGFVVPSSLRPSSDRFVHYMRSIANQGLVSITSSGIFEILVQSDITTIDSLVVEYVL